MIIFAIRQRRVHEQVYRVQITFDLITSNVQNLAKIKKRFYYHFGGKQCNCFGIFTALSVQFGKVSNTVLVMLMNVFLYLSI
jgi:hypothetical protein